MAAYEYLALDARGKELRGVLEGDSVRQIRQALRDRGLSPLAVDATAREARAGDAFSFSLRRGISTLDRAMVTRQLSTLLAAGIPLEESLSAVAQQTASRRTRNVMMAVRSRVLEGHSLASSLGDFPSAFPQMYRATVSAGEQSGHLDQVLDSLSDYTERRHESQQNVQMAMIYPIVLTLVAFLMMSGLMVYVVPQMVDVFADTGQQLPWITRAVISVSEFMQSYYWLMVGLLVVLAVVARWLLLRPDIQVRWHRMILRLPIAGRMSRGANAAQLASTLGILTGSGVPLVEAMRIGGEVLTNLFLRERVANAAQRVSEGASLFNALSEVGHFPPLMLHMVASGEASGELDQMLVRLAKHQQTELERLVTSMVRLFEPLMLLIMGALVLVIVLAIMMPIVNMNEFLGK